MTIDTTGLAPHLEQLRAGLSIEQSVDAEHIVALATDTAIPGLIAGVIGVSADRAPAGTNPVRSIDRWGVSNSLESAIRCVAPLSPLSRPGRDVLELGPAWQHERLDDG